MTRRLWRTRWLGQVIAVVGLLTVVVGLCLFHFEHHGISSSGMCPDPCSIMVSTLAMGLLAGTLLTWFLLPEGVPSLYAVSRRLLEPPPEVLALT